MNRDNISPNGFSLTALMIALAIIPSIPPNGGLGPLGNGMKGDAHKDPKLNPINNLYSISKDGVTKNQPYNKDSEDDIILACDGSFVGLSSDD